jgi:hypothetical protein
MVDRGFADPRRANQGQHNLDRTFSSYYEKCKRVDPPPQPQQALPNSTVRWIAATFLIAASKRLQMIGDLVVLAFFLLLRVGEYTPSNDPRLTIPLRKKDVRLWRGLQLIPHDAPLAELLTADAVTLCLENQKNGNKNSVLHHTSSGDSLFNPVTSAARLVDALRRSGADAPLGSFVDEQGRTQSVSAADIRAAIRLGAVGDNLESYGYDLRRIGSHSLRSGGAMRLKLAGYDDDVIKKLGRWSGNTYLHYIQTQIGNLTAGIATNMARVLRFHNVGA